jgi:hypothetical protein
MGASRRAHHRAEEAKRQAAAEAANIERIMRQSQENMRMMAEAYKPPPMPEVTAPTPVASTLAAAQAAGTSSGGIRLATSGDGATTGASKRKSVRKTAGGTSALRIPLNIGGSSTSGLNIG